MRGWKNFCTMSRAFRVCIVQLYERSLKIKLCTILREVEAEVEPKVEPEVAMHKMGGIASHSALS